MGCGKTTVGKLISKRTGMPLLDMDALIEEQMGMKISQIFAEQGEEHFRTLETALLRFCWSTRKFRPLLQTAHRRLLRRPPLRALRGLLRRQGCGNPCKNAPSEKSSPLFDPSRARPSKRKGEEGR